MDKIDEIYNNLVPALNVKMTSSTNPIISLHQNIYESVEELRRVINNILLYIRQRYNSYVDLNKEDNAIFFAKGTYYNEYLSIMKGYKEDGFRRSIW